MPATKQGPSALVTFRLAAQALEQHDKAAASEVIALRRLSGPPGLRRRGATGNVDFSAADSICEMGGMRHGTP